MILVFDTSALSRFINEDINIMGITARTEFKRYVIPLPTDAEIRFGFKNGSREAVNLRSYNHMIRELSFEVVAPDKDTALIYADLATWAKQHGVALSHNDLWIAATSYQLSGQLLTLDQDFQNLPQVSLVSLA